MSRRGKAVGWLIGVVVLALIAAGLVYYLRSLPPTGGDGGGNAEPGNPNNGPVLMVKIDNIGPARPATGLGSADVIYVEPMEGGLTRIAAVFSEHIPSVVGPVRSARQTDYDLLAQYEKPTFAYSGAVPQIVRALHSAPLSSTLINASQADAPGAYFRDTSRAAPDNLYLHPEKLTIGTGPTPQAVFSYGAAPAGGTVTADFPVRYPADSFTFRWTAGAWKVSMDGTPFTSTESGQLSAATVIVQKVATHPEPFTEDAQGGITPVAQTVGTGAATVLRDGQQFAAAWSRPTAQDGTTFTLVNGGVLALANGPIWVLLVQA